MRFDTQDFSKEKKDLNVTLCTKQDPKIISSLEDVDKVLSKIEETKACGPDNICKKLLKSCQIAQIFTHLFQPSGDTQIVPKTLKTDKIVPVLSPPKCKNDLPYGLLL